MDIHFSYHHFFLNLFMAVLGLCFCARAFSSCGKRGPLFIAVCGPLTIAASLVVEHRLQMRRLSNCGSRTQLLRGMWDLPRPGLKPVSPALAGRFSTTAPPGKPPSPFFEELIFSQLNSLGTLVESQLAVVWGVYFWTLSSIPLVYVSVFMPKPHYFDYCSFVAGFEIRKCESSKFVLLFQDSFGYSGPLAIPY